MHKENPERQGPLDHTVKDMSAETAGRSRPLYNTAPVHVHCPCEDSKLYSNPVSRTLNAKMNPETNSSYIKHSPDLNPDLILNLKTEVIHNLKNFPLYQEPEPQKDSGSHLLVLTHKLLSSSLGLWRLKLSRLLLDMCSV